MHNNFVDYSFKRLQQLQKRFEYELHYFFEDQKSDINKRMLNSYAFDVAFEFVMRPSKRLRPLLLILLYEVFTSKIEPHKDLLLTSISLEIMHSAILIHDDIADESDNRSRLPTLHKRYDSSNFCNDSQSAALFVADSLFYIAQLPIFKSEIPDNLKVNILKEISILASKTSEGQVDELYLDTFNLNQLDTNKLRHLYIAKTTSTSVECPIVLSGMLANVQSSTIDLLRDFSKPIGVAFQLLNDLNNYTKSQKGINDNSDINRKKRTMLIILIYPLLSPSDRVILNNWFSEEPNTTKGTESIITIMAKVDVKTIIYQEVNKLFEEAKTILISSDLENSLVDRLLAYQDFLSKLYIPSSIYTHLKSN